MSEIPYVNRLGDCIEVAIAGTPERSSRFRRRRPGGLVVAVAALLTLGGGVALATIFASPTKLAATGVACYATSDLSGGVSVDWAGDLTPAERCRRDLRAARGGPVGALATCDNGTGAVAVFPGRGADACERAGLRPLPAGYSAAQARVSALEHALIALESGADCIAPRDLTARVQALLDRSGWTGWRPELRLDIRSGRCGAVSSLGGAGSRTISGALDADRRRVMVTASAPRSTVDLLYSRSGIAGPLMDASGERCYDQVGVRDLTRRRLESTGRALRFTVSRPPTSGRLMDRRSGRLAAGCAVVTDVTPDADGLGLVVQVWQRR